MFRCKDERSERESYERAWGHIWGSTESTSLEAKGEADATERLLARSGWSVRRLGPNSEWVTVIGQTYRGPNLDFVETPLQLLKLLNPNTHVDVIQGVRTYVITPGGDRRDFLHSLICANSGELPFLFQVGQEPIATIVCDADKFDAQFKEYKAEWVKNALFAKANAASKILSGQPHEIHYVTRSASR